jgi:hypothetical protein
MIFSYTAPFDKLLVGGKPVETFPYRCAAGIPICFRDFRTFGALLPFVPHPSPSDEPVLLWRCGDFLVISTYNYDGPAANFTRTEINRWRSGFALELATADETRWDLFLGHADALRVEQSIVGGSLRSIRFLSGEDVMTLVYDPFREAIVSRLWAGAPDEEDHFTVIAAGETSGPFCPPTLFGSEVME